MAMSIAPILFDRWFADFDDRATAPRVRVHHPPLDLKEQEDRFEIFVDLPGLRENEIEVEFDDGMLSIQGERKSEETEGNLLRCERAVGRFVRTVSLGVEVDVARIEAAFKDGVLRVTVPKSDRVLPRQIPISVN